MRQILGRALARTAALWPDIAQAYRFVHAIAHWLGNPQEESAAQVRRRFNGVLGAMLTRVYAPSARELGAVNRERWSSLRQHLEKGRQARTLRTRFRHDPAAYLAALEQQACQLTLPS